jgi:hypothetical protein
MGCYIFLVWKVMILVQSNKYEWSIIDAPEIEGWNAGAKNTMKPNDLSNTMPPRRHRVEDRQHYLHVNTHEIYETESYDLFIKKLRPQLPHASDA